MAQVTFEALVDWLIDEAASGENHELRLLPIPDNGAPTAEEFFSLLKDAIDLPAQGQLIDRDDSQWLVVDAFRMYYVYSYEYDASDAVRTMHEVYEFIDYIEESAEEEAQDLRDTYESLRRDLDSGL